MIENYNETQKENQKSGIITAFYSAYFQRLKKLTGNDLKKVLNSIDRKSEEMTAEEMFEAVKALHVQFGGE